MHDDILLSHFSCPQKHKTHTVSFKGELHSKSKLCVLCYILQLSTLFWKSILKQVVWETQKWCYIFGRLSSSEVIDQNNILNVLINISKNAWPTRILMLFLSFSDKLLQDAYTIFQNSVDKKIHSFARAHWGTCIHTQPHTSYIYTTCTHKHWHIQKSFRMKLKTHPGIRSK